MDLDKYIVIATVLETNDRGETTEIARHFINQSRHVARRKRDLGQVAIKIVNYDWNVVFCSDLLHLWVTRRSRSDVRLGHFCKT